MKVVLFGSSGMVGQGVLRECLLDLDVTSVLSVVRVPTGKQHEKLKEVVRKDFFDFSALESTFAAYDTCFFCLGVSSAGMSEAAYSRVTYDITLAAAKAMPAPQMKIVYVSGASTDSTEKGSVMWARIKGKTENALLKMPFQDAYMFRPGFIEPLHGIRSKTPQYRILYSILWPLVPIVKFLAPSFVTSTEKVGRAMLLVVKKGAAKKHLENRDINALTA